jgi:hypothetical protein
MAGSFQGIWQGLLASLAMFLPLGVCQTVVAGHLLRRGEQFRRIFIPYLEVGALTYVWSRYLADIWLVKLVPVPLGWRFALLLLLLTAWLTLVLIGVLRDWRWRARWLLHAPFAAAVVAISWASW